MDAAPPSRKHRLPATFRSLVPLRVLNVIALATSLAAVTGATFGHVFGHRDAEPMAATALSTFVVGLAWAVAMRARKRLWASNVRAGWVASIPLAALNGALACGLLMGPDAEGFMRGFVVGGTFGAIMWIPGLLAVLALYGVPIATSQSLAEKGLAGEERGERIVGIVSAIISVLALVVLPKIARDPEMMDRKELFLSVIAPWLIYGFAMVGHVAGVLAAVLATYRDRVRRTFVKEVEAGAVQGFRVDTTNEGKVLVRVTSQGGGYRAATFDEQVYGLDETGDARRALTAD